MITLEELTEKRPDIVDFYKTYLHACNHNAFKGLTRNNNGEVVTVKYIKAKIAEIRTYYVRQANKLNAFETSYSVGIKKEILSLKL